MMFRHAELLCEHMGEERGCKEFRKHISWYLKGFAAGGEMRRSLGLVDSLASLEALLSGLSHDEPFPVAELGTPRGRQGSPATGSFSPRAGSTTPTEPAAPSGRMRPRSRVGDSEHVRKTWLRIHQSPRDLL